MSTFHRGLVVAVLALAAGGAAWAQNAPRGDAANGKRVYLAQYCYTCHGRVGQGGAMNYPAPVLAQTQMPPEAFKAFVRVGPNDMPAYPESGISDKEIDDMYAFIRSLPGRRAPRDFPLLNP